jgi:hypothetical protein
MAAYALCLALELGQTLGRLVLEHGHHLVRRSHTHTPTSQHSRPSTGPATHTQRGAHTKAHTHTHRERERGAHTHTHTHIYTYIQIQTHEPHGAGRTWKAAPRLLGRLRSPSLPGRSVTRALTDASLKIMPPAWPAKPPIPKHSWPCGTHSGTQGHRLGPAWVLPLPSRGGSCRQCAQLRRWWQASKRPLPPPPLGAPWPHRPIWAPRRVKGAVRDHDKDQKHIDRFAKRGGAICGTAHQADRDARALCWCGVETQKARPGPCRQRGPHTTPARRCWRCETHGPRQGL